MPQICIQMQCGLLYLQCTCTLTFHARTAVSASRNGVIFCCSQLLYQSLRLLTHVLRNTDRPVGTIHAERSYQTCAAPSCPISISCSFCVCLNICVTVTAYYTCAIALFPCQGHCNLVPRLCDQWQSRDKTVQ